MQLPLIKDRHNPQARLHQSPREPATERISYLGRIAAGHEFEKRYL